MFKSNITIDSMNESFWKGKNVLVTGADGFIGSHLTERLLFYGANVSVFVRGTSHSGVTKLKNINHIKEGLKKVITGDISSEDTINTVKKCEPEHIFHLAAQAYVNKSFEQPLEVIKTNDWGTLMVLEAIRQSESVKQAVFTSSSEIYGSYDEPIKEGYQLNPTSPYGASKAAADRYCFSYWNTYNLPVSIIRPFNTYGPRHTYDVVPKFIKLAIEGKDLTIYGDGEQSRDLTYVDDTVNAFLIMASNTKAIGEAVNFGTGKDFTINQLAKKIVEFSKSKSKITHIEKRLSEVKRLCCDYSKAKRLFNWEPKTSLDEGLKKNIKWELDNK